MPYIPAGTSLQIKRTGVSGTTKGTGSCSRYPGSSQSLSGKAGTYRPSAQIGPFPGSEHHLISAAACKQLRTPSFIPNYSGSWAIIGKKPGRLPSTC